MRSVKANVLFYLTIVVFIIACRTTKNNLANQHESYIPQSKELHDTIVYMDSVWGDAYNACKVDRLDSIISEDLEFYHDKGGLSASKESVMNAYKNNVCGKVTRELLKGSIEVYPIHNYGAVEMGRHRFYTSQEDRNNNHHFAKFVHIWRRENGQWRITRVISLH